MRRFVMVLSGLLVALGLAGPPLRAESSPEIEGEVAGLELCPQSVCGAAIFTGDFEGQVGNREATGRFTVAANHEPLPDPGKSADLTGGEWRLRVGLRTFRGIIKGGTIFNNGDETFDLLAVLELTEGGEGELFFVGTLDHRPLSQRPPRPPRVTGAILQELVE